MTLAELVIERLGNLDDWHYDCDVNPLALIHRPSGFQLWLGTCGRYRSLWTSRDGRVPFPVTFRQYFKIRRLVKSKPTTAEDALTVQFNRLRGPINVNKPINVVNI